MSTYLDVGNEELARVVPAEPEAPLRQVIGAEAEERRLSGIMQFDNNAFVAHIDGVAFYWERGRCIESELPIFNVAH